MAIFVFLELLHTKQNLKIISDLLQAAGSLFSFLKNSFKAWFGNNKWVYWSPKHCWCFSEIGLFYVYSI